MEVIGGALYVISGVLRLHEGREGLRIPDQNLLEPTKMTRVLLDFYCLPPGRAVCMQHRNGLPNLRTECVWFSRRVYGLAIASERRAQGYVDDGVGLFRPPTHTRIHKHTRGGERPGVVGPDTFLCVMYITLYFYNALPVKTRVYDWNVGNILKQ